MITKDQMFEPLLAAVPELWAHRTAFIMEWEGEAEGLPNYIFISEVVRECISMFDQGQEERVAKILDVVELWLKEGDPYVQEVATVGFLEDLQNENLHRKTRPEDFADLLGPESSFWWEKLNRFWQYGEVLHDDRDRD